jgi:hypothetical protein
MTPTRTEQMIREYGGRLETLPLAEVIARREIAMSSFGGRQVQAF